MTEQEYIRLSDRILELDPTRTVLRRINLSREEFAPILARILTVEEGSTGDQDIQAKANRSKRRLLEYVKEQGPFIFVNGKCLFILVAEFELDDWQRLTVPVCDVTREAQHGFRTKYERDPQLWLRQNGVSLTIYAFFVLGFLLLPFLCSR